MPTGPLLKKVIIQNFKSIRTATLDLSSMTFLVGRNGSGKSNIADAFSFISEAMEQPLQTVLNRRGGASSVARRLPMRSPGPSTNREKVRMGLAFFMEGVPRYPYPNSPKVDVRYAFELETTLLGYRVLREQCVVKNENTTKSWFERYENRLRSDVELINDRSFSFVTEDSLAIQFLGGLSDFEIVARCLKNMAVYSIDPTQLREYQKPEAGRLATDASNAASVLLRMSKEHPHRLARLTEIISSIIPNLAGVRAQRVGRKENLRFTQRWQDDDGLDLRLQFDAFSMSDGTLRTLGLLLAMYQEPQPTILFIEEPETSIHPGATGAIVEQLRNYSETKQVIVTTHSPEVLDDIMSHEEDIRVVTWSSGETSIGSVQGAAREALRNHLSSAGDLFRMRILDAEPLFTPSSYYQPSLFEELE